MENVLEVARKQYNQISQGILAADQLRDLFHITTMSPSEQILLGQQVYIMSRLSNLVAWSESEHTYDEP